MSRFQNRRAHRPRIALSLAILCGVTFVAVTGASAPQVETDFATRVETLRGQHSLPALAVAVVRTDEGIVASSTVGLRRTGGTSAARPTDSFRVNSVTKAMTATVVSAGVRFRSRGTFADPASDDADGVVNPPPRVVREIGIDEMRAPSKVDTPLDTHSLLA